MHIAAAVQIVMLVFGLLFFFGGIRLMPDPLEGDGSVGVIILAWLLMGLGVAFIGVALLWLIVAGLLA